METTDEEVCYWAARCLDLLHRLRRERHSRQDRELEVKARLVLARRRQAGAPAKANPQ